MILVKAKKRPLVLNQNNTQINELQSFEKDNKFVRNYHMKISPKHKKSTNRLEHAINMEAKHIAKNIKLEDLIKSLAKAPAFITLKHKENFRSSHPCCLINPSKSKLGKVSKVILEKVTTNLVDSLKVN